MGLMSQLNSFFRKNWGCSTPEDVLRREFGVSPVSSVLMRENQRLWRDMYVNHPPWESCEVRPLGLPGAIGRELARYAMSEFSFDLSGGERAEFLKQQLRSAEGNFLNCLELGLCLGGIALKPYPDHGRLAVDISAQNFMPVRFDGQGKVTGGIFKNGPVCVDGRYFVRLEYHDFLPDENGESVYVIRNRAFSSGPDGTVRDSVRLECVPDWAGLAPDVLVTGLKKPLFAFFKPPYANDIEPESMLGTSVYAGAAADLIRQADEQWRLIRWEFESGKRRIYVDGVDAGQFGDEIFAVGPFSRNGDFFNIFSPEFRDQSLYAGFQRILQRIEFQVGLAYGTISDPQSVEKTATEIIAARHRQYVTGIGIQKAFQNTLQDLLDTMDAWCDLAGLAPGGSFSPKFSWGDGVLDDPEVRRLDKSLDAELVQEGLLSPWEFRMKWFGEDEHTARAAVMNTESTG